MDSTHRGGLRAAPPHVARAATPGANPGRRRGGPPTALLLVAHGSRDPRHAATVTALTDRVRALRPDLRVECCYLDFTLPAPAQVLRQLYREGAREIIAVPLLLTHAHHATVDIPQVLAAGSAELPGLAVRQAPVLGPDALLVTALTRRLAVPPAERARTGVVLAAAGSSHPEAIAVIAETAREWRHSHSWCAVRPAFASAASPTTADAVRAVRADGARRVVVAPYVIAPGRLPDRIAAGAAEAGADLVAPVIGDAPELARLVVRRFDQSALRCSSAPQAVFRAG